MVVDVAMNPERAMQMRAALEERAGKAPIHSIVYTHSHVVRMWWFEDLVAHCFHYHEFDITITIRF